MAEPTPEQIKEFQEKVNNMSPEELKDFQKQQCIFCQIVDGKVASKKIYEDDKCLGVLDINPANPGHVLLMPKEHFPLMPLMPEEIIGHLFMVAKALSRIMLTAVNAEGASIFVANGSAAGQRAQHFMMHIIPRKTGDKIKMDIPVKELPKKEVDEIRKKIVEKINSVFKIKEKVIAKPAKKAEKEEAPKKIEKKPAKTSKAAKEKSPSKKPVKKITKKAPKKQEESDVSLDDIAKLIG
ncbi:MAG: HIT family protein [Candidatus Woesearchaeota archaeon]